MCRKKRNFVVRNGPGVPGLHKHANMKRTLTLLLIVVAAIVGASATNRLTSRTCSMDAPDGYIYNKTISDNMNMEVYTPSDSRGAIAFGVQDAQGDITPSALATVLANALIKDGVHTAMVTSDGTPVHLVTSKDSETVLAIAGDKNDKTYTVVIFNGASAAQAPQFLKTLKKK